MTSIYFVSSLLIVVTLETGGHAVHDVVKAKGPPAKKQKQVGEMTFDEVMNEANKNKEKAMDEQLKAMKLQLAKAEKEKQEALKRVKELTATKAKKALGDIAGPKE